jgi:hypothetical protein
MATKPPRSQILSVGALHKRATTAINAALDAGHQATTKDVKTAKTLHKNAPIIEHLHDAGQSLGVNQQTMRTTQKTLRMLDRPKKVAIHPMM